MKIKSIRVDVRRPTTQYGYENYTYEVEIDSVEETIEQAVRHIMSEHDEAVARIDDIRRIVAKSYDSESIDF